MTSLTEPFAFLQDLWKDFRSKISEKRHCLLLLSGGSRVLIQFSYMGRVRILKASWTVAKGETACIATVCQKVGGVTLGNKLKSSFLSNKANDEKNCTPSMTLW